MEAYSDYDRVFIDNIDVTVMFGKKVLYFITGTEIKWENVVIITSPDKIMYYRDGKLHRDIKPAIIYINGNVVYYFNGVIHRDGDNPAIIMNGKNISFYKYGKLHRDDDKPAYITNNYVEYYNYGLLHRDDGPASIHKNSHSYYKNNLLHRVDGPAVYKTDKIECEYYIDGLKHRDNDFATIDENGKLFYYDKGTFITKYYVENILGIDYKVYDIILQYFNNKVTDYSKFIYDIISKCDIKKNDIRDYYREIISYFYKHYPNMPCITNLVDCIRNDKDRFLVKYGDPPVELTSINTATIQTNNIKDIANMLYRFDPDTMLTVTISSKQEDKDISANVVNFDFNIICDVLKAINFTINSVENNNGMFVINVNMCRDLIYFLYQRCKLAYNEKSILLLRNDNTFMYAYYGERRIITINSISKTCVEITNKNTILSENITGITDDKSLDSVIEETIKETVDESIDELILAPVEEVNSTKFDEYINREYIDRVILEKILEKYSNCKVLSIEYDSNFNCIIYIGISNMTSSFMDSFYQYCSEIYSITGITITRNDDGFSYINRKVIVNETKEDTVEETKEESIDKNTTGIIEDSKSENTTGIIDENTIGVIEDPTIENTTGVIEDPTNENTIENTTGITDDMEIEKIDFSKLNEIDKTNLDRVVLDKILEKFVNCKVLDVEWTDNSHCIIYLSIHDFNIERFYNYCDKIYSTNGITITRNEKGFNYTVYDVIDKQVNITNDVKYTSANFDIIEPLLKSIDILNKSKYPCNIIKIEHHSDIRCEILLNIIEHKQNITRYGEILFDTAKSMYKKCNISLNCYRSDDNVYCFKCLCDKQQITIQVTIISANNTPTDKPNEIQGYVSKFNEIRTSNEIMKALSTLYKD